MIRLLTAAAAAFFSVLVLADAPIAQQGPQPAAPPAVDGLATATFAAGCFWCTESDFDKVPGVVATTSGYIGGTTKAPTYKQVSSGRTGHTEAVQVRFDPKQVSYAKLLEVYWRNVDPLDGEGQFCDRGSQYRPAIFTHGAEQQAAAEASRAAIVTSGRFKQKIAVEILPASEFTAAEDYHQDYYKKDAFRYRIYRHGCGRDARLDALWSAAPASPVTK